MTDNLSVPEYTETLPGWFYKPEEAPKTKVAKEFVVHHFWQTVRNLAAEKASQNDSTVEQELANLVVEIGRDEFVRNRIWALAADSAFVASNQLEEAMQPIQTHIVLFLKENGLFQYLEIDSIIDFLESKKSPWDGEGKKPGNHFEIEFMADFLIPTMEANGIPRADMLDITINFSKARYALPTIRRQLDHQIQRQREIKAEIQACTDPDERLGLERALQDIYKLEPGLMKALTAWLDEMKLPASEGLSRTAFQEKLRDAEQHSQNPIRY